MLDDVHKLTALVERHRAEQRAALAAGGGGNGTLTTAAAGSTLSRTEETVSSMSDSEERGLLSPKRKSSDSSPMHNASPQLQIDIEPSILILRGEEALRRDRSVNQEFS